MRSDILNTKAFWELDAVQQAIYRSKSCMQNIIHCYNVANLSGIENMIKTQRPSGVIVRIVQELLN